MISCDPLNPTTEITWQKDKVDIPSKDSRISTVPNGTSILTVAKPTEQDAAEYTCSNKAGESRIINVWYEVTLTKDESHTTAPSALVEGRDVWVALNVTGVPAPALEWTKNGAQWTMPAHVTSEEHNKVPNATLHFKEIQIEDSGTYICNATGQGSQNSTSLEFKLDVKAKYAALVPFLAICAGAAVLSAVTFYLEKRALQAQGPPQSVLPVPPVDPVVPPEGEAPPAGSPEMAAEGEPT